MSLIKQAMKLKGVSPFNQLKRGKSGWPHTDFYPGMWGECTHVLHGARTQHFAFWVRILRMLH